MNKKESIFGLEEEKEEEIVESEVLDSNRHINIDQDSYSLSFVCYLDYYMFNYNIKKSDKADIFQNVCFVFTM